MIWVSSMAVNSIWANMDKDSIINEIRNTLSYPGDKTVFVVVEGADDIDFFHEERRSPDVVVVESYSGKPGVIEIVEQFSKRVIGVCDHDYETPVEHDRIFYYDHCCLEMMIVANDAYVNRIFRIICNNRIDENFGVKLRDTILLELKWLSVFRRLNYQNQWGVNFGKNKQSPVSAIMNRDQSGNEEKTFQITNAESEINQRSGGFIEKNANEYREVLSECNSYPQDTISLLDITQGHDFIQCLASRFKKNTADLYVKDLLIQSYMMEHFCNTNLCQALRKYEGEHNLQILTPQPT